MEDGCSSRQLSGKFWAVVLRHDRFLAYTPRPRCAAFSSSWSRNYSSWGNRGHCRRCVSAAVDGAMHSARRWSCCSNGWGPSGSDQVADFPVRKGVPMFRGLCFIISTLTTRHMQLAAVLARLLIMQSGSVEGWSDSLQSTRRDSPKRQSRFCLSIQAHDVLQRYLFQPW